MRLKIPYYAQTSEFSCGPACLLMVCSFLDRRVKLTRAREFSIWRQCTMIGIRGADPFGMSIPLLQASHEVRLLTGRIDAQTVKLRHERMLEHGFAEEDVALAQFGMADNRRRARALGLPVTYGRLTVERVREGFREGCVPIVLVHMGVVHQLEIPHWIVVTRAGEGDMTFHDPYPPKGGRHIRVSDDEFRQMIEQVTRLGHSPSALFVGHPR
ncbi:MAG: peptidase C39 family protein [Syntrophaceae bacterium]|nr:peptidase C39 family protein [Syntrophaceae bacterium]